MSSTFRWLSIVRPGIVALALGIVSAPLATFAEEKLQPGIFATTPTVSLFDGKTLGHWTRADFGKEGVLEVKDGELILGRGNPMTGVLWKGPELPGSNYELSFEARRVEGNDFFSAVTFPVKKNACTLVLGGWGGGLTGLSSINGSDASENETTGYFEFQKGQWYKVRIRVTDDRIDAFVDDKPLTGVDLDGKQISLRIEMELCRPLGFASYRTQGAIKNIELRQLPAADKAN
ncbi:3-keto-disaccharide hydrolase [Planctomicrobium piriforme]|uniref:3-keto-disaccharide hydrolase n=1 Tax=Planctomicrobium piriforme TaxID=1576369 RepID=UPI001587B130|nr:DUF1080 domain-containing protein [Planctomicrobium piriforme]